VRQLGLFDSAMVTVGIVIGSGIFLTTGIMAKTLPSAGWILLAWVVGGLLTMAGALTYAELGAALPEAGGQYVYLREAYGPMAGFLFGWILFLVYMTGGIAGLALAFAEYFGYFFPSLSIQNTLLSTRIQWGGAEPPIHAVGGPADRGRCHPAAVGRQLPGSPVRQSHTKPVDRPQDRSPAGHNHAGFLPGEGPRLLLTSGECRLGNRPPPHGVRCGLGSRDLGLRRLEQRELRGR